MGGAITGYKHLWNKDQELGGRVPGTSIYPKSDL